MASFRIALQQKRFQWGLLTLFAKQWGFRVSQRSLSRPFASKSRDKPSQSVDQKHKNDDQKDDRTIKFNEYDIGFDAGFRDGYQAGFDQGRLPDPFVVLTVDGAQTQTTKALKRTLSPYWNETFEVRVKPSSVITAQVFDQRKFKKRGQGFLGVINVQVGQHINVGTGGQGTLHCLF
ncbi:hypothetical protein FB639_001402 [Coemansia asiatica]|nr:hypothetical protein FB639_001402 [Coemansia asiatica]